MMDTPRIIIFINEDFFFKTHFLPIFKTFLKESEYEIYIISKNCGFKDEIEREGFYFFPLRIKRGWGSLFSDLILLFRLGILFRSIKPNVIINISFKLILIGSISSLFYSKAKVINYFSGLGFIFLLSPKNLLRKISILIFKLISSIKCFYFIFENKDDRELVFNIIHFPFQSTIIIPGVGIDLNEFEFSVLPEGGKTIVLFPARILSTKGVLEFISAAKNLKNKYQNELKFIITGKVDPNNPYYISEKKLRSLIDPGYIDWLGFVYDIQIPLKNSNIVVLPSYREGLPKVLIEACSIGRAIIASNVAGCKECVREGFNGFLVPVKSSIHLSEKIEFLVNNRDLQLIMGRNSRTIAENKFNIQIIINQWKQVLAICLIFSFLILGIPYF